MLNPLKCPYEKEDGHEDLVMNDFFVSSFRYKFQMLIFLLNLKIIFDTSLLLTISFDVGYLLVQLEPPTRKTDDEDNDNDDAWLKNFFITK